MALMEFKNISKEYYGNKVLKGISLTLEQGEIHGIVGENGAGKSTFMNILFGMPVVHSTGGYEGEILLDGKPVAFNNPAEAIAAGIGMVHQEFMLIPGFTVAENIKLNRENTKANIFSTFIFGPKLKTIDARKNSEDARKALDWLGMSFDESIALEGLPIGYMQFVEVAREIDKEYTKVLVFDEPTAVLSESEAEQFLITAKRLAAEGKGILFISHRLDEVIKICDRITVLKDGEIAASMKKEEATIEIIAELMVGRKLNCSAARIEFETDKIMLEIKDLSVDMPGERVKEFSVDIFQGEILGIGGLTGHGKIGIANGIMGLFPAKGSVLKGGKPIQLNNTRSVLQDRLAFVSEDRHGIGLLLDESIETNIVVTAQQRQNKFLINYLPFLSFKDNESIRQHTKKMIEELDIRCVNAHQPVRRLSGGNQQKVCIARAITLSPDILFVSEPTRGIDIGAKRIVLDLLLKLNRELGVTIIMTSSELAELRLICDRIAIVYEGKLEGILRPTSSDLEFGLMMAGEYQQRGGL